MTKEELAENMVDWRPVSEKPEKNEFYIWLYDKNTKQFHLDRYYYSYHNLINSGYTHWAYAVLPEPPKE